MKLIKGLVLFCFLGAIVSSCFNPPEFRDKPEVIFKKIYYGDNPNGTDSLVLVFDFKDGDGDLGLNDFLVDSPFHEINFLAEGTPMQPVSSLLVDYYVDLKSAVTGKQPVEPRYYVRYIDGDGDFVTFNSKTNGYPGLPAYAPPYSTCQLRSDFYLVDTIYIHPRLKNAVTKSNIVDSLIYIANNSVVAYSVVDTFYVQSNPNQYNFTVRFYERVGGGFQEFDWREEFCSTFDGRFIDLSDEKGPLEGTVIYPMKSSGFLTLFSIKTLYLEFEITDRALNKSNTERTFEFTLNEIKQK